MNAAEEWARCRPMLEAALERSGGFDAIETVETRIREGTAHFWPGKRAAAVTEFRQAPTFKALNYWLLAGDLEELLGKMQPHVERFAILNDCSRIMGIGRPGWGKKAEPHGFKPVFVGYLKELI